MRGSSQSRRASPSKIEREDGGHHGERGKHDEMRRVEEMAARVVEHRAPARHGREDADAEKAERGLGEDRARHRDGGLHEHRLENIRQKMTREDARVGCAERARGENVLHFLRLQNLRAGEPCVAGPAGDDQGENYFAEPGPEKCGERDGQKNSRETKETR